MKTLCLILLFAIGCIGCVAEMTIEERAAAEYREADRRNRYVDWEATCLESGNRLYSRNASRSPGGRKKRVPRRYDWNWDRKNDRPHLSNSIVCISPQEMSRLIQQIKRELGGSHY